MTNSPAPSHRLKTSPRARRFAADYLIRLENIPGSGGLSGRITEDDIRRYLETSGYFRRKITPSALNLAKQEKLDMAELAGNGDNGRIRLSDVRDAVMEKPYELSPMRKIIAERLSRSKQTIPHFYVTVGVEMDTILKLRKQWQAEGFDLSVNVFIVKAAAMALKDFPMVNAETDGSVVRRKTRINVGAAVSVENGLMVPVVRNADHLKLDEIQTEISELAAKARSGRLRPDEMRGGTFTVSNMGMLNVECFGAIINPGEGGILAVASTIRTPIVRDDSDEIVIRHIMKISFSADHRIIDGAVAAAFVNRIKKYLEDEEFWMQEI
ncbi:MAG: 2-oxo acid dehydrogenase subunit E2 [Victivallales bacterium]|nr:2-oxo acid dehydrogenase subunit E2 [Victivallales bacterium]